jgi:hypothetical protein
LANVPARVEEVRNAGRRLASKGRRIARSRLRGGRSPEGFPVFFVVGQSRSGTTWLMRLLNAHPEVLCMGEGRFFGRDWREEKMKERQTIKQPSSLHNALATSPYLKMWMERSVWSRDGDTEDHARNLTRLTINYFMGAKLAESGKKMVGDKTPLLTTGLVREISDVYPEAKVLHIVRDGRDRAVSLMHYLWNTARKEGGLYPVGPKEMKIRDSYREDPEAFLASGESIFTERRLRKMAASWAERVVDASDEGPPLLGENYTEVRYEDLLSRPGEESRRLFASLGAASDDGTVRRCVEATSFERRTNGRKQGQEDPTSVALRKGVAGDWRNVFTERDREVFKEEAGKALVRLGYEKDLDW